MKYYDGHENTYRRLEVEGHTCWDRRAFDDFFMRPFLDRALETIGAPPPETMAWHPAIRFDDPLVLADDGVLWLRYADGNPEDTRILNGAPVHPNRRILPPDVLTDELRRAGFVIEWSDSAVQELPGEPLNFRAILRG